MVRCCSKAVLLKGIGHFVQLGELVIVAHGRTRCFPNVLLWGQIGCPRREVDDFQSWIGVQ